MASHRLKRSMRGALAATAVAAAVGMSSAPAIADPQLPDNASDAAKQVRDLSHKAEVATEEFKKAEDDHEAKIEELDRANAEIAKAQQIADQARAEEEKFRGKVDNLTTASYQGARMNKLSALLVSESPNDFLDRASALEVMSKDNNEAISKLSAAVDQAEGAERQAKEARAAAERAERDAARLLEEAEKKKSEMDELVDQAEENYAELSGEEQDSMVSDEVDFEFTGGSGTAAQAVQAALGKRGSPYVYGAKGPSSFDCSGLVYWAYQQVGVSVGGSTKTQVTEGKSVSPSQLKPGDLIFYGSPVYHVSMYIGGGKAVHAPTTGDVVKVANYKDIATPSNYRRVAG
ncbi:C40 family peptidase [Parasphingorhabdus pacifica]